MEEKTHFIDGNWQAGQGTQMASENPATGEEIWRGTSADDGQVSLAVDAARAAFASWSALPLQERIDVLERYQGLLTDRKASLAEVISKENGKPLWDSLGEVTAMINKIAISIEAYHERTPTRVDDGADRTALRHRPHGVLAVYGPYNFPGHLPNGHIVPALLAGNTVIFKPSELTPAAGEAMVQCWIDAGLPDGALNLIQGGAQTGQALSRQVGIDGLLFTGSATVGSLLHKQFGGETGKILALELGGNNPLVVHEVRDIEAAVLTTIQSAFITSGQRCTCARRLIVPNGKNGDEFIESLTATMDQIKVGPYTEDPAPFMGPVISNTAANQVLNAQTGLLEQGAIALKTAHRTIDDRPFVTPGLLDVSACRSIPDSEIFGPVLQLIRTSDFQEALEAANATRFGLAAGLLSDNRAHWDEFFTHSRAGIVNWNKPLTGASSKAPFGGIGLSGNHRPSAYYAADYCAYPMASMEADELVAPVLQGVDA
jgi:succinylglutamic semialdehyde dehydrogenase